MKNETNELFPDPYATLPPDFQHRTSIVVDKRVWAAINTCRGHRGTLQTTINVLLNKLHEQLIANDLTSYDPRRYEHAVLDARISLGGTCGSTEPNGGKLARTEAAQVHDGGGTGEVAQPPAGRRHKSANPRRAPAHGENGEAVDKQG